MSVSTPAGRRGTGGIDVDRDEEVASGAVGDIGTRLQVVGQGLAQLLVGLARVDHLYTRHSLLDQTSDLEGHLQRQVLFVDPAVMRSGKLAAVAGIDHDNFDPVCNIRAAGHVCQKRDRRQYEEEEEPCAHI